MLKVERHFVSAKTAFSKRGVLRANLLPENLRKRSPRNKRDKGSAQEVKTFNLDSLKVAASLKRMLRTISQSVKKGSKEYFAFDDSLSGKLLRGYTVQQTDVRNSSGSCVTKCLEPA